MTVDAYLAGVDRLLARGHGLFPAFGTGGGVGVDDVSDPPVPAPPAGGGSLTEGVANAGDGYQRWRARVAALDADTNQAADDGSEAGAQGRANSGQVRDTARAQADAIAPATNSPAGARLLVSTMDQRVADMQRELDRANAQNRLIAVRMRQLAMAYQGVGSSMGLGGGGMPFSGLGGSSVGGGAGLGGLSGLAALPAALTGRPHENANAGTERPGYGAGSAAWVANPSQADLQAYIIAKGRQLGLTATEIGMALAVAKHESNWRPVGFMGFGPEAKSVGLNFDRDSYGAIDQYYRQYVSRLPAGLDRNSPAAIADYIWHTVHVAADPHYGPSLLTAYENYRAV